MFFLTAMKSKPRVIAIVDDDEPLREALASVLKADGYAVAAFHSAEDFLGSEDWRGASVLLLDVRLPGMSGVELQLHMLSLENKMPIVFITGHGDSALRDVLLGAGASAFLNKPVRSEALLSAIRTALDS